jgi:peptidoglycan/LPS O-acetylase OafA/YrhL
MLNELTIDAPIFEKIFLADYSGFFCTGLLIYELYLGRRDTRLQALLASAIGISVFQAVHNLAWLRDQTGLAFDDWIVAAICLVSIWTIIACTQIRRFPIPSGAALAIGGLTYPLYLLHQKLGYVILSAMGPTSHSTALTAAIVLVVAAMSWLLWRFFERPTQKWLKRSLKAWASRSASSTTELAVVASIERCDEVTERVVLADR